MTLEELALVVGLLASEATPGEGDGAFAAALLSSGVGHISAKTIVYRELNEDDVVISRQELGAQGGGATAGEVREAEALAHLGGREAGVAEAPAGAQAVQNLAADVPRLAALIVQAAQVRTEPEAGLAGELVACVRRAIEAIAQGEGMDTQRGRKQMQKQLRELEREVLGLIGVSRTEDHEGCTKALKVFVAEMQEDLQIDVLAVEYAKRLKAIGQTEKRLARYLKMHGANALQDGELGERLREEGVGPEQWGALLAAHGLKDTVAVAAAGILNPLLVQMERAAGDLAAQPEAAQREVLTRVLGEVQSQVGELVERTAQKIRKVTETILADEKIVAVVEAEAKKKGQGLRMTRKELLEMLAEVVQELCQPLAVITCSIDMIQGKMLGAVSDAQLEMLKLVAESTAKLQSLVDGLQKIAGVPETMTPDRELLKRVTG